MQPAGTRDIINRTCRALLELAIDDSGYIDRLYQQYSVSKIRIISGDTP
jgi:hypothetical protein